MQLILCISNITLSEVFNSKKVKSSEIIQNQVIQQKMQSKICSAILNISFSMS